VRYGYTDARIQPFPHLAIDLGIERMPEPELLSGGQGNAIGEEEAESDRRT